MSRPLLLGLDGRSGAGKTTLAAHLLEALHHRGVDATLLRLEELYPGWDGLDAAVATYAERLLPALAAGRHARWRAWDWVAGTQELPARVTRAADVVLVEGVGACAAPALRLLDAGLFLELDPASRRERALSRDGETFRPHWERWAAQESGLLARSRHSPKLTLLPVDAATSGRALRWALRAVAASR